MEASIVSILLGLLFHSLQTENTATLWTIIVSDWLIHKKKSLKLFGQVEQYL